MSRSARWGRPAVMALLATVLAASGCARAAAERMAGGPALQVPEPPPRVLAPLDDPLPATAAAGPDAPPPTAPQTPVRSSAPRQGEPRAEAPAPPPVVAQTPPEPVPAPAEILDLRAGPSSAAERTVRDLLARAARDLSRVDYGRLSSEGRSNYDQSKRFSQQAEQALKDRNFAFATTLADKSASLAGELLGLLGR